MLCRIFSDPFSRLSLFFSWKVSVLRMYTNWKCISFKCSELTKLCNFLLLLCNIMLHCKTNSNVSNKIIYFPYFCYIFFQWYSHFNWQWHHFIRLINNYTQSSLLYWSDLNKASKISVPLEKQTTVFNSVDIVSMRC